MARARRVKTSPACPCVREQEAGRTPNPGTPVWGAVLQSSGLAHCTTASAPPFCLDGTAEEFPVNQILQAPFLLWYLQIRLSYKVVPACTTANTTPLGFAAGASLGIGPTSLACGLGVDCCLCPLSLLSEIPEDPETVRNRNELLTILKAGEPESKAEGVWSRGPPAASSAPAAGDRRAGLTGRPPRHLREPCLPAGSSGRWGAAGSFLCVQGLGQLLCAPSCLLWGHTVLPWWGTLKNTSSGVKGEAPASQRSWGQAQPRVLPISPTSGSWHWRPLGAPRPAPPGDPAAV